MSTKTPLASRLTHLILHELRAHSTPSLDLPQARSELFRRIAEQVAAAPGVFSMRFAVSAEARP